MENRDPNDDHDDIESNMLLPAGVTLRWATLSLKIFRAEDIPQSKTSSRSLIIWYLQQMKRSFKPYNACTEEVYKNN